jgi:death-on-curing protein
MRYVTYSELIFINGTLLGEAALLTGKQKVRDLDLLLAAEQRPQASAFGADAYPTLPEKAAALLHSIARNHPFRDGNKRTATVAALFMLAINGQRVLWQPADALHMILEVAEGRHAVATLAAWLQTQPCPPQLIADESRDTRLIHALVTEHQWLLDELATR